MGLRLSWAGCPGVPGGLVAFPAPAEVFDAPLELTKAEVLGLHLYSYSF